MKYRTLIQPQALYLGKLNMLNSIYYYCIGKY
ncbi:hypothetical protein NIES22_29820 [Calothrix brevissima NIES-22]|nr:hypothetical protein NIES22_29820 [Calothrix brevissima NIES-22]